MTAHSFWDFLPICTISVSLSEFTIFSSVFIDFSTLCTEWFSRIGLCLEFVLASYSLSGFQAMFLVCEREILVFWWVLGWRFLIFNLLFKIRHIWTHRGAITASVHFMNFSLGLVWFWVLALLIPLVSVVVIRLSMVVFSIVIWLPVGISIVVISVICLIWWMLVAVPLIWIRGVLAVITMVTSCQLFQLVNHCIEQFC